MTKGVAPIKSVWFNFVGYGPLRVVLIGSQKAGRTTYPRLGAFCAQLRIPPKRSPALEAPNVRFVDQFLYEIYHIED
jgi:hypothetical protein